jgi:MscS family membrane protein
MTGMKVLAAATTQPMWEAVRDRVGWMDWVALAAGIFAGVVVGKLASSILTSAGRRVERRGWPTQAAALEDAAGPLNLTILTFGLNLGMVPLWNDLLRIDHDPVIDGIHVFFTKVIRLLYIVALAWFLFNLVDVIDKALPKLAARTKSRLDDQLVPLVRKTLRIFVVVVFALFTAQNVFEQDITAWLAGLGIAGLAVSLAAQDSIKNVFGSVTIFMDHPFGVGDFIKVAGAEGTVEEIGFRSTKLRTPVGHLVSIPNSKIVDGPVENVTARPYIRRLLDVTVPLDTPAAKARQGVEIIRQILAEAELAGAWREKFPPRVYFDEFNPDSLRIRVIYWHHPADFWTYADHAQRFNVRLMEEFERAEIALALPARSVFLAGDPKRRPAIGTAEMPNDEIRMTNQ